MTIEPEKLLDVEPDDFIQSLAHALRYNGRKRTHDADDYMGRVAAERLYEAIKRSGFVVKKKPPAPSHSAYGGPMRNHLTE